MSELAALGFRVTIPEVDVGTDVLAFLDTKPGVTAVQVKSTECKRLKAPGKFSGQIEVSLRQLMFGGDLYYIFAFGLDEDWVDYILISRETSNDFRVTEGIGTERTKDKRPYLKLNFSFNDAEVMCGKTDFNDYRNAWQNLPLLNQPEATGKGDQAEPVAEAMPEPGQPVYLSAQTAVMSRLLRMGCNVALAEVDKLLAFQDEEPGVTHIRVKPGSGIAGADPGSYAAELKVSPEELKLPSDLYYVFPLSLNGKWLDFIIISRERLDYLRFNKDVGREQIDAATGKEYLKLTFSVSKRDVTCDGVEFNDYRDAWKNLPSVVPAPDAGPAAGSPHA